MKVIFAGPSIATLTHRPLGIEFRPPAVFGDIEAAVRGGASVIGLIDGRFQQVGSVWHKEILLALSQGVQVLGAASMGALRAAECEPYGMIAVGEIARGYAGGELCDDADVALLHAPEELGYAATTEPLVNVAATACRLEAAGAATRLEADALLRFARSLHFSERSIDALVGANSPVAHLACPYLLHRVDQKAYDAGLCIDMVAALPDVRQAPPPGWTLLRSRFWENRAGLTPN
jgi:hypothetical protein